MASHDGSVSNPLQRTCTGASPAYPGRSEADAATMTDLILYVNIPFCTSKCHFCLWVAQAEPAMLTRSRDRYKDYAQAVLRELHHQAQLIRDLPVQTKCIFFGGGTPSILEVDDLAPLIQTTLTAFRRSPEFETATIECSPQTLTREKLSGLRAAGFNRLSIGVQSLNDERLRRQARSHTGQQALQAYEDARAAGFDNINLDLIVGLPDETFAEWQATLQRAVALQPDHITVYIYKPYPGTTDMRLIQAGKLALPTPEETARRFRWSEDLLTRHSYEHYMHQSFTRNGKVCNSDTGYFNLIRDWIGFGAGAHSLFQGDVWRHPNHLYEYLADPLRIPDRAPMRFFPNLLWSSAFQALHTRRGIHFATWQRRMGISFADTRAAYPLINQKIHYLADQGWIDEDTEGIRVRNWDCMTLMNCRRQIELLTEDAPMPAAGTARLSTPVIPMAQIGKRAALPA
jgi:coproporphyrinogen III oxidase-like Fe-S oxidoreductase